MSPIIIWLVGVTFLLFQFFLQLTSGIVINSIMLEQGLSALMAGLLSSTFYYVYSGLQIPVGLIFDRFNARTVLSFNAALCALGCFIFANTHSLPLLFLGRLIIGTGSAFAFVGVTLILRTYLPLRIYPFMIGLTETLGFLITVIGMVTFGSMIHNYGWRLFINISGGFGLIIASLLWFIVPNTYNKNANKTVSIDHLILIMKNKYAWINGIFVGLEFTVITVFGALWAIPFLKLKMLCSLKTASYLTAMIFLGTAISCPLFGQLATIFKKRKPLVHFSCLSTAALMMLIIYLPTTNLELMGILLFLTGLCCGAYMLAYSISNEFAPEEALSTCTGFTNTLGTISAPIFQPLVGFLLDLLAKHSDLYTLTNYQTVLIIVPLSLVVASVLMTYLPE